MAIVHSLTFGQLLARYRIAAGLTQETLAEQAGVSVRGVSDLERGVRRSPYRDTLLRLAAALSLVGSERERFFAASGRGSMSVRSPSPQPTTRPPHKAALPLVGRAHEMAQLARHLVGDDTPVLLFAGEPGIGKTRLLREAAGQAAALGMTILEGGCRRQSGQAPYAPLLDALEQYLARTPRPQQRTVLQGCAWLVRLLPELADMALAPVPSWELLPDQERRLMFAAVGHFLHNVAGPAGALLLLDDLQWAGADALDLLASLLRAAPDGSLRVVGAYRDTETRPDSLLELLLADLARDGLVTQVSLAPLPPEDAGTLLESVLLGSDTVGSAQGERALRRAGGVPFNVITCAQALRAGAQVEDGTDDVPWNVAQPIRQRVAALPEPAQDLLAAAAVASVPVHGSTLASVVRRPDEEMLDALDAACHARLLVEAGEDIYQVAHDLIGEVVVGQLTARRRKVLHQRLAEALEQRPGGAPVAQLAYHYGRAGNVEKELEFLECAGDRARALRAIADAERHYRTMVERLDQLGRTTEAARTREKLGDALASRARFDEAVEVLEHAAAEYGAQGDREGRVRVATSVARVHARRGDSERAIARLQQESNDLPQLSDRSRALVYAALMYPLGHTGRYQETLAMAEQAAGYARAAGVYPALFHAEIRRGHALTMLGRLEEAKGVLEEVLDRVQAADADLDAICSVLNQLGATCTALGDNVGSMAYAQRAVDEAERLGNPATTLLSYSNCGWSAYLLGNWERARESLERAVALAQQVTTSWAAPYALLNLGVLCLAQGQQEVAWEHLDRGIKLTEHTKDLQLLRWLQQELAEVDLLAGQAEVARARLAPVVDERQQESIDMLGLLPNLAWAHLELGNDRLAETLIEQCLDLATVAKLRPTRVAVLRVRSLLAIRQECWPAAHAALEQALPLARAMPSPYEEAKLLATYGYLYLREGLSANARRCFERALARCVGLGERLYGQRIERCLADL